MVCRCFWWQVDSGREGARAWGSEISRRAQLEHFFRESRRTPLVLLVVQGGLGTVQTVEATARAGDPSVLLVDSGGAAAAIAAYVTCDADMGAAMARLSGDEHACSLLQNEGFAQSAHRIHELHSASHGQLLTFFSIDEGAEDTDGADLSRTLLEAIVSMHQGDSMTKSTLPGKRGSSVYRQHAEAATEGKGDMPPRAASKGGTKRMSFQPARRASLVRAPGVPSDLAQNSGGGGRRRAAVVKTFLFLAINWNCVPVAERLVRRPICPSPPTTEIARVPPPLPHSSRISSHVRGSLRVE